MISLANNKLANKKFTYFFQINQQLSILNTQFPHISTPITTTTTTIFIF